MQAQRRRVVSCLSAPALRVLSLGAGVQSTTLALMAASGEIERPDCAMFADTGWEPRAVYEHLARLEAALPFPVHRVSAGNLRADILASAESGRRVAAPPWFLSGRGMMPRQCTADYKIAPLARKQRELLGVGPRSRVAPGTVEVWIGISRDEAVRMRPARSAWQRNCWPLIELGLSRADCLAWLARAGWNAPKSACIGCPYHSDEAWRKLRETDEWADAVEIDRALRGGMTKGMRADKYMHRSLVPLDEVDLSTPSDHGQTELWGDECDGICGV